MPVEIRDTSLWVKHIRGDAQLKLTLEALAPGDTISLVVDGRHGTFEKMKPGPNGPMQGLKPVGDARHWWRSLYPARRGELVDVALAQGAEPTSSKPSSPSRDWTTASDAEREAAWEAFKALTRAGWRSEGSAGDRDELHER